MDKIFLYLHIVAGFSALLTGGLSILLKKGSKNHIRSGNLYFWSMMLVSASAFYLSVVHQIWFLFAVGLFSGYLSLGGKLVLMNAPKESFKKRWQFYSVFGLLIGLTMLAFTAYLYQQEGSRNSAYIILAVFSAVQLWTVRGDIKYLKDFTAKTHIIQHLKKMSGAYLATLTAFLVVNVKFLPQVAVWLSPALVGTILIVVTSRRWTRKLGINKQKKKEAEKIHA